MTRRRDEKSSRKIRSAMEQGRIHEAPEAPVVRSARHMLRGAGVDASDAPEAVLERLSGFWRVHLVQQGLWMVEDDRVLDAYINQGRWVADCPNCNGGIAVIVEDPQGCCLDCGHHYRCSMPNDVDEVVQALAERPEQARNFDPGRGETIAGLKGENDQMKGRR